MTVKVGDKVRLHPESNWTNRKSIERAKTGRLAEVVAIGASMLTVKWPEGDLTAYGKHHFLEKPLTTRENLLAQVRRDRAVIEREMVEATKMIKIHQKTIEEAVPKLEEYDGIIADLL